MSNSFPKKRKPKKLRTHVVYFLFSLVVAGYNFYQVALHEIGHSLGLEHSYKDGAVMTPDYPGFMSNYSLADDDVRALQVLYGKVKDNKIYIFFS